jgi:hypothetical protein
LFSKGKIQQETKVFQIGNDVESEQEKAFSNKKIAKAKELYLHLI